MICKKCNSSIPDDSVFCLQCGNTIGKISCPKCEQENDDKKTFCMNCGYRIDGKIVCKCGKAHERDIKFCPDCGDDVQKLANPNKGRKSNDTVKANNSKTLRILNIVMTSLCLFSILLLFIACFTQIFVYKIDGVSMKVYGNMFFDHFYQTFNELVFKDPSGIKYVMLILSLLFVVANIAIIGLSLIFASIRFIKFLTKQETCDLTKNLLYSLLSTFFLVLWFNNKYNISGLNIEGTSAYISIFYIIFLSFGFLVLLAMVIVNALFKTQAKITDRVVPFILNYSVIIPLIAFLCLLNGTIFRIATVISLGDLGNLVYEYEYSIVGILEYYSGNLVLETVLSLGSFTAYATIMVCGSIYLLRLFKRLLSSNPYKVHNDGYILSTIIVSSALISFVLTNIMVLTDDFPSQVTATPIVWLIFGFIIFGTQLANKIYISRNYE